MNIQHIKGQDNLIADCCQDHKHFTNTITKKKVLTNFRSFKGEGVTWCPSCNFTYILYYSISYTIGLSIYIALLFLIAYMHE